MLPRREATLRMLRLALIGAVVATPFLAQYGRLLRWGWTLCTNDLRLYAIPVLHWVESRVHQGHLPIMAPIYGGYPIYADPQSLLFYPPAFLAGFLPTPANFQALTLFHLAAAFAGCYVLGRRLRMDVASSLLVAMLWTSSGFFVTSGLNTAAMLYALAWWPWLLWSLMRLDERPDRRAFAAAIGFGALEVLAGHPQMAFYFALLWLGWLLIGPLKQRRRTALASAAVAAGVLALTAFAWLSWRMLSRQTIRALPTVAVLRYCSMPPNWLPGIVLPHHSADDYAYLGLMGALLALAGALCRRRFGLGVVAVAALLMALGGLNPLYTVLPRVPIFNQFRCPMRYLGISLFLLSILAGYGMMRLSRLHWLQIGALVLVATELTLIKPHQRLYVLSFTRFMQTSVAVAALKSRPPGPYFFYTHRPMRPLWVGPGSTEKALLDPQFRLMSDENLTWDIPSVQGYTPLAPLVQTEFLVRYGGSSDAGLPNRPELPGRLRELRRLGCRYVLSTIALPELAVWPTTRLEDGMLLYDLGLPPFALLPGGGRIERTQADSHWREMDGIFDRSQSVIFTMGYWPELRAWVDGAPCAVSAKGPNPAVAVPGGRHRIRIAYVPTALYVGLGISGASVLVLVVALAYLARRGRTQERAPRAPRAAPG
jgi:hypothetical protein